MRGGARVPGEGKRIGRPPKPQIEQRANKGIASKVLAMKEPPADHKAGCLCEVCAWWQILTASDTRLRFDCRRYLTDRRDGKPAQGVFVGDTRESARELDFGDLPEFVTPGQSKQTGKPN